ncbi:MAG TPA: A/G-specific adenine glycosylase [Flavipsychrobacter sp.]
MNKAQQQYFTRQLMHWHATHNDRSLPWKEEKDPYKIWLSEIILQQTRAQQGLPYYLKFTEAYPTVTDLSAAGDEEVFRLWQGLGYYNRCRNMLATARYIVTGLRGKFPDSYEAILSLKGIGPYTAAAIASFAYGLPHAVVDGNVYRVLSRYFGIDTPIDSTQGKKEFTELANQLLDKTNSAGYNQAIMDLGATVCKPASPDCGNCPLQRKCFAYEQGLISDLPVKNKKLTIRTRFFHYILFINDQKLWIHKRTGNDIWQNLHEPYLVEDERALSTDELVQHQQLKPFGLKPPALKYAGKLSQRLTHRLIETHFYTCEVATPTGVLRADGYWVPAGQLDKYAFPKTVISFFEKNVYFY